MAKIYISSTYYDLKKEREAAAQAVKHLGHESVCMENYVAGPQKPVKKCLKDVRSCDVYLGIFAWRYGFVPNNYDKSITHLEYETARKAGIPCLIFLLDQEAPWTKKYIDTGEDQQKIDRLRNELKREYIVSFFKSADELSSKVIASITELVSMVERSFIKFKRPEELIGVKLGKYIILEKLGRGGKGVVFKVQDTLEESTKAIKMVPPRIADSPLAFKYLKKELKITSRIIHPNVVKVFGLEKYGGHFFIVMDYIEGKSLEQKLADSNDSKLEETEVIEIMKKMAQGLIATHNKDIIHRDIKPSNVMVTPDDQVIILDFGISYQVTKSMTELVGEHQSIGTWPYMAPEQFLTRYGRINKQVDIWGFGVTMYQLLTGQLPFDSKDQIKDKFEKPFEMVSVSRRTRKLVMKCLEKDRKKRFQNMEEVLKALNPITYFIIKKTTLMKLSLAVALIIFMIVLSGFFKNLFDRPMSGDKPPGSVVNTSSPGSQDQKNGEAKLSDEIKEIEFNNLLKKAKYFLDKGDFEKARENLNKAENIFQKREKTEIIKKQLNELEYREKQYEEYYASANDSYNIGLYKKAMEYISKAEAINIKEDIKKLKKKTLEKLDERKKQALIKRDDEEYENAVAQNTISAYRLYLEKYKQGRHRLEAEKKISVLEKRKKPDYVTAVVGKAKKVEKNIDAGCWEAHYDDGIIMVYIPAGEFKMGSKEYKDGKPHVVYLDSYWIGKTQVTNSQYVKFLNDSGTALRYRITHIEGKRGNYSVKSEYEDHPVIEVSWNEVWKYCRWLSNKMNLNFKLPTEAQWEKAARGTDGRKYPWGDHEPSYKGQWYANYVPYNIWHRRGEDGFQNTAPVDSYPYAISPYGILNMAGNVWEWCNDWYAFYKSTPKKNPTGPRWGSYRVVRGGDWNGDVMFIRCAYRFCARPSYRFNDVGFRLCQDN